MQHHGPNWWPNETPQPTDGNSARQLRIAWAAGYRVYYARLGRAVILPLCGGDNDKHTQDGDIEEAIGYLKEFKRRLP